MNIKNTLCLALSILMLSACGQPGPLYLPGQTPPFYVPPVVQEDDKDDKAQTVETEKPQSTPNQTTEQQK